MYYFLNAHHRRKAVIKFQFSYRNSCLYEKKIYYIKNVVEQLQSPRTNTLYLLYQIYGETSALSTKKKILTIFKIYHNKSLDQNILQIINYK